MLAQEWAERCAKHAHIMFSEISGIGENITFFPKTIDPESSKLMNSDKIIKMAFFSSRALVL